MCVYHCRTVLPPISGARFAFRVHVLLAPCFLRAAAASAVAAGGHSGDREELGGGPLARLEALADVVLQLVLVCPCVRVQQLPCTRHPQLHPSA